MPLAASEEEEINVSFEMAVDADVRLNPLPTLSNSENQDTMSLLGPRLFMVTKRGF